MAYPTDPIYKLVKDPADRDREICVMKKEGSNTLYIPITSGSEGNRYYEEYLEWSKTNTAEAADGLTWDDIRDKRNDLLKNTDWTMTTGATVDQAQWAAYRQIIRDIPQTYKDKTPDDVVWPTQPSTAGPNT